MKRITKIRIPKGNKCGKCRFLMWRWDKDECSLFPEITAYFRCSDCLKMFPNGAVFVEKEKK